MVKYAVSAVDSLSAHGNHLRLKTNSWNFNDFCLMHVFEISLNKWEWMVLVRKNKIPLMISTYIVKKNLQIVDSLVLSSSRRTKQSTTEHVKLILLSLFSSIPSCFSPLSQPKREREAQTKITWNYAKIFSLFVLSHLTFKIIHEKSLSWF